jgi:hypothetical protein
MQQKNDSHKLQQSRWCRRGAFSGCQGRTNGSTNGSTRAVDNGCGGRATSKHLHTQKNYQARCSEANPKEKAQFHSSVIVLWCNEYQHSSLICISSGLCFSVICISSGLCYLFSAICISSGLLAFYLKSLQVYRYNQAILYNLYEVKNYTRPSCMIKYDRSRSTKPV